MSWSELGEMFEVLDSMAEQQGLDERFSIEETIRAVFGNEIEVIEFEPYDSEGNTITRKGN